MNDAARDPFGERRGRGWLKTLRVLGCEVRFSCDDKQLFTLVKAAYGGLPAGATRGEAGGRPFAVEVRRAIDATPMRGAAPPPVRMSAGAGLLCGIVDAANYALIDFTQRRALVSISPAMLRFAYHARYELIEFAVLTLLARAAPLVPLHAACFGWRGRAVLLMGDSGAGKSTLCMQALHEQLDFVSEDSVFVTPRRLTAFGPAAYLHLKSSSLRFLRGTPLAAAARSSPIIRRRSGARKFEMDLRRANLRIARDPPRIAAVILLAGGRRGTQAKLVPLGRDRLERALREMQPYASGRDEWPQFCRDLARIPAFELRRGSTPAESLELLRELLVSAGGQ